MSYLTVAEFTAYFRSEIVTDEEFMLAAIAAAEVGINEFCQRTFGVAGTAAARTYTPDGSNVLRIHDATTITTVVEDGATLTAGTDFIKEPAQQISWSGETRPYTHLRRVYGRWYANYDLSTVTVTATWGWLAVPAAVRQAALILTKELLDQREVRFGIAAVNDFGPMRVRANPQVQRLLAPYRRVESWGLA